MGWVATVACALIITMFVYNWLNRDEKTSNLPSISQPEQEQEFEKEQNGRIVEPGEDGVRAQGKTDQKEKIAPTSSSQPTAIVLDSSHSDDHISERQEGIDVPQINIDSGAEPQATDTLPSTKMAVTSPSVLMPPPPLPSSKPSTNTSKPPSTARSQIPPRLKPPTIGRPPTVTQAPTTGSALRPPPSAASSLRVPPTKVLPNIRMAPSLAPPSSSTTTTTTPSTSTLNPRSKQITLSPGHSPLDWAALTTNASSIAHLRGKDATDLTKSSYSLLRITPSQLKAQNGRKGRDAWTVFQGKVYNLDAYVPFHPGGKGEILRGAGKDSATMFMEVHPWVNWDGMLSECCIGVLVSEEEGAMEVKNGLDEMD